MDTVKTSDLTVNQVVTILEWKSHKDRSWVGDLLKVVALDKPFVVVQFQQGWNKGNARSFHEDDVVFGNPSKEYVEAVMAEKVA